jgi:hypothetical protein
MPPARPFQRALAVALALVATATGAFLLGSFDAAAHRAPASVPVMPATEAATAAPAPRRTLPLPTAAPQPPVAPSGPAAAKVVVTPDLVARVAEQARERLEGLRPLLVRRCWPEGGPRSRAASTVVVNLTFDASGREIARGISESRRAPAGEAGACLRKLRDAPIAIAPPGATVGVSVPLTLP